MPLAHSLSVNLGLRYSDYTNDSLDGTKTSYGATTYKAELDYAPSRDIRFRASYNHAIRAPNVAELFAARGLGNVRSEEHTSELQSLMRLSYAVLCLKKKTRPLPTTST